MTMSSKSQSIIALRWVVGLVVLWESFRFTFSHASIEHVARFGLSEWHRYLLGGSEIVAALLFLIPVTTLLGGIALLVIFAIAVLIHLHHGQFDVSGLIVYAAAVLACITHRHGS